MRKIVMLVGMLLAFGASASDSESFIEVVAADDIEQVKSLLAAGTDVNAKYEGFAALHLARSVAMIKVLIDAGAKVSVKHEATGYTPLHMAALSAFSEENDETPVWDYAVITALVEAGADVNATDVAQMTALHYAAATCNAEVISTLIRAGAEVNLQAKPLREGKDPMTPLDVAANCIYKGGEAIKAISVLIDNGAEGKVFYKMIENLANYNP